MPWLQLQYRVNRVIADSVGDALEQCGALAVSNENAGEDEFFEVAFPGTPGWQQVLVTGMFEASADSDFIRESVQKQVPVDEVLTFEATTLFDQDWERAWMDSFKPLRVGDNMWVCPTGYEPPEPGATNILLDPGLAFGTGGHPTTGMCLDWISSAEIDGKSVLDYGCGSGILGIAAALRGAGHVDCVDIDPLATAATMENARRNGVSTSVRSLSPGDLDTDLMADIVIANILCEVIVRLAPALRHALREDGVLLLSGILDKQVEDVRAGFGSGIEFEIRQRDQWCLMIGNIKVGHTQVL